MYILGINMGQTQDGKSLLKDGGACLIADGEIITAIAEERLTRRVYEGGFEKSIHYCLDYAGIGYDDLDMIVVSSCAEEVLPAEFDPGLKIQAKSKIRVMPSHHLSHAYTAFMISPFEEAIIMVIDNEGNIIGPRVHSEYWLNRLERNSYYIGSGTRIAPIIDADDNIGGDEIGPGEAYRYFTYYLGWHSYVYAGKTMGLAPYGHGDSFNDVRVFELKQGKIKCLLPNKHRGPLQAVIDLGQMHGVDFGPPRIPNTEITQRHRDLAFLIQDELERAIIDKVNYLHQLTGLKQLCIAGGVGLNCVVNRKILDCTPIESIFIQPAAGDSGQCLGNALYGSVHLCGQPRKGVMSHAYFGREYSDSRVRSALRNWGDRIVYTAVPDLAASVASLIAKSNVIAWFQGGSELGPRALGHRSILADPRQPAMQDFLNLLVKRRESFRPYAPSVLLEHVNEYFDIPCASTFMLLVATVHPEKRSLIPAVTHIDGTSRLQTVTRQDNGIFYDLIHKFKELTGVPLILNTSFNLANEPIVETPEDALDCFMRAQMDYLILHNYLVQKADSIDEPLFKIWSRNTLAQADGVDK